MSSSRVEVYKIVCVILMNLYKNHTNRCMCTYIFMCTRICMRTNKTEKCGTCTPHFLWKGIMSQNCQLL